MVALLQIAVPTNRHVSQIYQGSLTRRNPETNLKVRQTSVPPEYGHDQLIELCLKPLLLRGCQLFRIVDKGTVGVESYLTFFFMRLIASGYIVVTISGVLFVWILNLLVFIVDGVIVCVVRVYARFLGACAEIDVQEVRPVTDGKEESVSGDSMVFWINLSSAYQTFCRSSFVPNPPGSTDHFLKLTRSSCSIARVKADSLLTLQSRSWSIESVMLKTWLP